ncbi:hypothetical protein BC829DRAFT_403684 [Chytridium lagenaria]|nr:hypothetical protein BC829DRAFT_403684 [Chytridium lagenaria]
MQATRRGIKVYQFKEPTNMQEENVSKGTIFFSSQDIFWNTLSKLLLAEIRDNTTFSISVICSHMVTLVTRFVSAATFKRLQMERKGKTAPILSEAYNEIQRRVTIKGGSTRKASVVKSLKVSDEESLPEYDLSKNVTTKIEEPLSPVVEESDSTSVLVDVSPKEPLSKTRFAFTNLASIFAEWCGRISAFLITLLLTSTPPQYTWTRCRDPLTVQTHIVRGSIMILLSLFMDSIGVLVEHRVAESGLKEAVEEFRKTKISWLVYLHMAMMACALSGVFVMTMPGILENGNDCFKAGRSVWV